MKKEQKEILITEEGNELIFHSLSNPKVVADFVEIILSKLSGLDRNLILNFKNITGAFANTSVPIAGLVHDLKSFGFNFEFYYLNEYLKRIGIDQPLVPKQQNSASKWLDRIWKFEDGIAINLVIENLISELSQKIVSEKGVLEGLEWSLSEAMDNVLRHSMKNYGFVMGQIHSGNKIAIAVFDTGIGIYNSLMKAEHKPQSPKEAIEICIKKGVTRDKEGQGFGLYGLSQIVKENLGHLMITSGSAVYRYDAGKESSFDFLPTLPVLSSTLVDIQITYTKEIPLAIALGGIETPNLRMEKLENEVGSIIYNIKDQPGGTSTRQSGAQLRNEVINIHKQTQKTVFLNFENVVIVASSFADEFIGKLVTEFGFVGFNNFVKLINLNPTVQMIVQRSVAQRMNEEFNS
ncbi:MAG: DUF4325 domain-containing protein [Chitinophagales bacterium]